MHVLNLHGPIVLLLIKHGGSHLLAICIVEAAVRDSSLSAGTKGTTSGVMLPPGRHVASTAEAATAVAAQHATSDFRLFKELVWPHLPSFTA